MEFRTNRFMYGSAICTCMPQIESELVNMANIRLHIFSIGTVYRLLSSHILSSQLIARLVIAIDIDGSSTASAVLVADVAFSRTSGLDSSAGITPLCQVNNLFDQIWNVNQRSSSKLLTTRRERKGKESHLSFQFILKQDISILSTSTQHGSCHLKLMNIALVSTVMLKLQMTLIAAVVLMEVILVPDFKNAPDPEDISVLRWGKSFYKRNFSHFKQITLK
ncbi:hypothetical protein EMCRGX_G021726 [Ephydatia muelleri]